MESPQTHSDQSVQAKDGSRERLLAAASELFAAHGFDGVSVKDLARKARVNVSLVSYHFAGKEGLYRSCLEQFGKARLAAAQRMLQPPTHAEELKVRLEMFIEELLGCHLEAPELTQILHRECDMEMPIAQDIFKKTFLKVFETLVEFIRAGQKQSLIKKNLDPQIAGRVFFGAVLHCARTDKINRKLFGKSMSDRSYRHALVAHLLTLGIQGMAESGPSKPANKKRRS